MSLGHQGKQPQHEDSGSWAIRRKYHLPFQWIFAHPGTKLTLNTCCIYLFWINAWFLVGIFWKTAFASLSPAFIWWYISVTSFLPWIFLTYTSSLAFSKVKANFCMSVPVPNAFNAQFPTVLVHISKQLWETCIKYYAHLLNMVLLILPII